jgi:trans-aconitate methyltransferase
MAILRSAAVRQFARPTGSLGRVAGWIMASRPSNRARNEWLLELLDVRPQQTVLELGYGPGYAIARLAAAHPTVKIVGIDHSRVMHAQTTARNRAAIAAGRLKLEIGDIETLAPTPRVDRIYSANVLQFVTDRPALLRRLFEKLHPDGLLATGYQPRHRGARDEDALRFGEQLIEAMRTVGFVELRLERGPARPVLTVAALGRRPSR